MLTPGGPKSYSNANSWYAASNARTAIGFNGMTVGEVAAILIRHYGVYDPLNLDGGGSTTLAMEHPITHAGKMVNVSSDNPKGRSVGSNLAVFAAPLPVQAGK